SIESIKRVEYLTKKQVTLYIGDVRDRDLLNKIFMSHQIDAVMHFAALKSVGESNNIPLTYYSNNITGTLNLLESMQRYNVKKLIFSSSATVYTAGNKMPNTESDKTGIAKNPYGTSKFIMETILKDISKSDPSFSIISLRYFNPTGAHPSGMIGENPNGIPNNLIPYVAKVAQNTLPVLHIYGNDYPTKDGTGVRDYIHVMDLALGHVKALDYIFLNKINYEVFNLGTGRGYSVLDVVYLFEKVSQKKISYVFCDKREGDVAVSWACPQLANEKLKWQATKDLEEMLKDVWHWQTKNPNGY
ncbi:UDP-glucose 4-epimerase GalE, partial [Salmonella enterica subsp. enterica serovar Poona]|nr:UDP-glucose 4-epimerase GalE [Salmonella enterica subsp. enterica]EBQ1748154.1 UDP-glucose 4-epimerase GalE [Salmonella enterica]ECX2919706.1 UDP-glucose 4-epimerase GalE [Salmonella enterica subsp. enterica serovar Poona]ECO9665778.1 UDP-glucose 4-epimerase GalE [Salmonella enterica]EGG4116342.1 UDP-glucose 4-epimerase GalE [Salmonella enterica]